jgi:hypothetical protein
MPKRDSLIIKFINLCTLFNLILYFRLPCVNGGRCIDGIANFTCNCVGTGYNGTTCELDVDECSLTPQVNCGNGTCNNLPGTYNCICTPGFTGITLLFSVFLLPLLYFMRNIITFIIDETIICYVVTF